LETPQILIIATAISIDFTWTVFWFLSRLNHFFIRQSGFSKSRFSNTHPHSSPDQIGSGSWNWKSTVGFGKFLKLWIFFIVQLQWKSDLSQFSSPATESNRLFHDIYSDSSRFKTGFQMWALH
jgi:hypothetical protein